MQTRLANKLILLVEDEASIRDMLRFALQRADLRVAEAEDVAAARLRIAEARPDLILLDWMLPGVSGIEFARELKTDRATGDIPVIMLTARAQEEDKVRGLNLGCDDYVAKPFSVPELLARIRAVLRRSVPGGGEEPLRAGGLEIDARSQRVTANGQLLHLGPTEYRLLYFLMSHPDRVYSREQLLDRVWGHNADVEERTVDAHVRRLRRALEPYGCDGLIQTVRGSGYRLSERP